MSLIENQIEIADGLQESVGNGVYRLHFRRGIFGGDPVLSDLSEGDIIRDGEIQVQVVRVWKVGSRDLYVDVIVLSAALPIVGLVALLISAGFLVGMFGWILSSATKLFDTTGGELCYDAEGNVKPCPKGIIAQIAGLIFFATVGWLVFQWTKK